jgi:hypothetical protein
MSNKKVKNEIISLDSTGEVVSFIIFLLTAPVTGAAILNVIKLMFFAILPKSTFGDKMVYKKKTMRFANPKRGHLTVQRYPEERPDNNVVVDRIFSIIDVMVEIIDWVATKYIGVISRILKLLPRFKKMSDNDVKHVAVTVYYTLTVGVLMKSIKLLMLKKGLSGDTAAFKSIRDTITNGLKLGSHGLTFDDIERESDVIFSHKSLAPLVKEFMGELGRRMHFLGEDVDTTFEYRDFYKELLNESMTATVADKDYEQQDLQDLLGISQLYMRKVIDPIFFNLSKEDQLYFRENRKAMDFFTPDGGDEFKATGVINFYTTGFKPETVEKMLKGVKYYASEMNIVLGNISKPEQSRIYPTSQVIRISVIKNNNLDNFEKIPEVQLSYDNAILIFGRLLALPDFEEGYTIAAIDLLKLIEKVEVKDKQDGEFLYRYSRPTSVDGNMTTGGITPEYLRRKLSELKQLCDYAIDNDTKDIVIV